MRSIWAVAVNTIKHALRIKIAVVFLALLIILLPVMGTVTAGDGTLKGRLQTFVSYGLSLVSLLLALLTMVISIYSLTNDIKQKQIYIVLTKPIYRFQFIMGKLLGIILLNAFLLIIFSTVIYLITIYTPNFTNPTEQEIIQAKNEFYTARAVLTPDEDDVSKEVQQAYQKLEKSGKLPSNVLNDKIARKNYIDTLTLQKKVEKRAAVVGQSLVWQFENVKPSDPNQSIFIKFKYDVSVNPPDLSVYGRWIVGDDRQVNMGTVLDTPVYTIDRKNLIRTFYEMELPGDAVAKDGYLAVGFLNVPLNDTVVIFPLKEGLEVLYKADSFTANFVRSILLIFFRLVFLAVLGVFTATFLSFPVALLFCLAVFFTGTISEFIIESFSTFSESLTELYEYIVKPLVQLLPQFDKINPANFLVPGKLLSWMFLAKVAGVLIGMKAFLLLVLSLLIFSYKEIAKIII